MSLSFGLKVRPVVKPSHVVRDPQDPVTGIPRAGSSQPEMLLVADDANAAYSNPRPLPKCAQTLLPCIALAYRTRAATRAPQGDAGPQWREKAHLAVSVVEPT